jgi:tetratricopeptide (TPR) repeat protein
MTLADAYAAASRAADAKAAYVKLTHADPSDADAWIKLAEVCWSQDDLTGTMTAANRALASAPKRPEPHLLTGMVWQKRGRLDDALRAFDQAASLAPQSSEAVILRGITLERAGKAAAAAEAYAEALRRQPDDSRAKALLANVTTEHNTP